MPLAMAYAIATPKTSFRASKLPLKIRTQKTTKLEKLF